MRLLYRNIEPSRKRQRPNDQRPRTEVAFTPDVEPTEPYAILSHTWGENEVTYEDVCAGRSSRKLEFTLDQAERDDIAYVWIDTCCIDKRDRNELGEAINSMWRWYQKSAVCYVYLADVPDVDFGKSRWFTRGWTLQELLAPSDVRFYDSNSTFIGDKGSRNQDILQVTRIDVHMSLSRVPISERWHWSKRRMTTKPEDAAYCMLGLLEVQLIFNYGEGADSAEERLLEAVKKEHGRRTLRQMRLPIPNDPCSSIEALLDGLSFDNMGLRRQAIEEPYPGTCRWIHDHQEYRRWISNDIRMLWIKGPPGTGKSVLVKSIEDGIAYYFNARGSHLEQSTLGMYRSLLYQLLRKSRDIGPQVLAFVRNQIDQGLTWQSNTSLQQTFAYAAGLTSFSYYIDALDECDQPEVREMVAFWESSKTHVLFASRYYPTLSIAAEHIDVRNQDIALYVEGKLHTGLAQKVITKANGIFFWAVLVVKMLNDDHARGRIRDIDALPGTLDGLLASLVTRQDDLAKFEFAMRFTLFSLSRVSPRVLCAAVAFETGEQVSSVDQYLSDCTRGLVEVTYDGVQPIHETVREVMFKTWQHQHGDVAGWAHELMADFCTRRLLSHGSTVPWRPDEEFDNYAAEYVLEHAEFSRAPEAFLQMSDLEEVCRIYLDHTARHLVGASTATFVHALVVSGACKLIRTAHTLQMCLDPANASALPIAVMHNSEVVLALLECGVNVNNRNAGGLTALHVWASRYPAIREDMFKILMSYGADLEAVDDTGATPLMIAVENGRTGSRASFLLAAGAKVDARDACERTTLHLARSVDDVELLLRMGADRSAQDVYGRTALDTMVEQDRKDCAYELMSLIHMDERDQYYKEQSLRLWRRFTNYALNTAKECGLHECLICLTQGLCEWSFDHHARYVQSWNSSRYKPTWLNLWWMRFGEAARRVPEDTVVLDLAWLCTLDPVKHFNKDSLAGWYEDFGRRLSLELQTFYHIMRYR